MHLKKTPRIGVRVCFLLLFLSLAAFNAAFPLYAQKIIKEKNHSIQIDNTKIIESDVVNITIENTTGVMQNVTILSDDFQEVGRVMNSRIVYKNNTPEKKTFFIARLMPLRSGKLQLRIRVDSNNYGPYTIEVTPRGKTFNDDALPYFAFAKITRKNNAPLYINEPAVLEVSITSTHPPVQKNMSRSPSHQGIALSKLPSKPNAAYIPQKKVTIDNKTYFEETSFSYLVYPLVAGEHAIEGAELMLAFSSNLNLQRLRKLLKIPIEKTTVKALDFPQQNKPSHFQNNFGDFSIAINMTENIAQIGQPIPIEIVAKGKGNFETLVLPSIHKNNEEKNHYFISDKGIKNNYYFNDALFEGEKSQTYYVTFEKAGNFTLSPLRFSSFSRENGYSVTNVEFPSITVLAKENTSPTPLTPLSPLSKQPYFFQPLPAFETLPAEDTSSSVLSLSRFLYFNFVGGAAFLSIFALFFLLQVRQQKQRETNATPAYFALHEIQTLKAQLSHSSAPSSIALTPIAFIARLKTILENYIYQNHWGKRYKSLRKISQQAQQELQQGNRDKEQKQTAKEILWLTRHIYAYENILFSALKASETKTNETASKNESARKEKNEANHALPNPNEELKKLEKHFLKMTSNKIQPRLTEKQS